MGASIAVSYKDAFFTERNLTIEIILFHIPGGPKKLNRF